VTAPATLTLAATASDPENRMAKVDFYVEGTMVASDASSPYTASWTVSTAGTYSLSAIAYDADGGSSASSAVTVTVVNQPNGAPTVSLTSPANGATFTAPANISLAANASDPEGQLARVEFYSGPALLGSDTSAPYTFTWSNVAAGTYSLQARAFDGAGQSTLSAIVSVTVNAPASGLPAGQTASDVGSPAVAGQTTYASGTYTVRAGGRDIWDTADEFHFVYQAVTGNTQVTARVESIGNTDPWAKAGVMVRESLTGGSRHAMMATTSANGAWFGRRLQTGGMSTSTKDPAGTPPAWVRLVRTGDVFQAYRSTDGASWILIGSDTIPMAATVYVGLAATGHNTTSATTVSFNNFSASVPAGNQPPSVSLTSPASGATFTAPATMTIAANASDPENQLARVEFYSGGTLLGTDTAAPFSFTWSNVAAGTYTLMARAYDSGGASGTSAAVNVTVNAANAPPAVSLTSPASGATFTAPATMTISANASDPENQLARVEFYSGSTLLGTDTAAPFSFTWNNVAAGTYSLTARAYDAAGASATSAAATVTVSPASSGAPNTVIFTASTDHSTNVTSYRLSVYNQGANPATATPVATSDLGKPTPAANNDITVDRAAFFNALAPGTYLATVTAIGPGGQTQSASVTFTR
jgi:regulation of enolase protein 1 (concanavalin A-like superfamily)